MKIINEFRRKWKAETPFFWKWIRNVSVSITSALGAGILAVSSGGLSLPEHTTTYLSYFILIIGTIAGYAGTREKKQ
ncbi:hypothetical protein [uncultured Bacteroides sp.]|uniref:hypothetical protein n=1 Tax=uncultured Bacteroides sp. TaxID=162156 RepID=UPI002AAB1315|nr:hypothetical protein [uncultured Bacteroides sp.]